VEDGKMTEEPSRYRSTDDQRAELHVECLSLLAQINRSPYAVKLLIGARDALKVYAADKAGRTHRNRTVADVVIQSLADK
jgi:hypothetical protein